jgi:glutamine synthetase
VASLRCSPHSPLVELGQVGNGWHLHTSVTRDGVNLLSDGNSVQGMTADGAAYLAGLLRDLPAIAAITAPNLASLQRTRSGYWSGAYTFWGVENREASLRFVPTTALLGPAHANIEPKPSDASANPFLALAVVIAAGLSGIEDGLTPPQPVQEAPVPGADGQREQHGIRPLPSTADEQLHALLSNQRIRSTLGEDAVDVFRVVGMSDAAWAAERTVAEVIKLTVGNIRNWSRRFPVTRGGSFARLSFSEYYG